jgi:dolichol-phosphate mannosyltransferase
MRTVFVILPVYNEAARLPSLFLKLREVEGGLRGRLTVIAVDDGSVDASPRIIAEAAARMEIVHITHAVNRGLRETMWDGYAEAVRLASDVDIVITMDADGTQEPAYLPAMIEKLDEGYDVVIASRYQPGARVRGVPWSRRLFSLWANILCRTFLRIPGVRDYACGYRVFRARVLRECLSRYGKDFLEMKGFGFICAVEAIVKAAACGARFAEVPFELRYDLKSGRSKMRVGRTVMGYFVLIARTRALRKRGRGMS